MLNFIDNGCPVIGKSGSESYVIITGYDSKNITYIDTASDSMVTVALTDASKMFNQWENVFITYYKNTEQKDKDYKNYNTINNTYSSYSGRHICRT